MDKKQIVEQNTQILNDFDLEFSVHNNGYHYIVSHHNYTINFYPSTGKWYDSITERKGKGMQSFLEYIGKTEPENI